METYKLELSKEELKNLQLLILGRLIEINEKIKRQPELKPVLEKEFNNISKVVERMKTSVK